MNYATSMGTKCFIFRNREIRVYSQETRHRMFNHLELENTKKITFKKQGNVDAQRYSHKCAFLMQQ